MNKRFACGIDLGSAIFFKNLLKDFFNIMKYGKNPEIALSPSIVSTIIQKIVEGLHAMHSS